MLYQCKYIKFRSLLALALCGLLLAGCGKNSASALPQDASSAASEPVVSSPISGGASEASSVPAPSLPAGVSPLADYPEAEITVDEEMYVNWVSELTWNCELYLEKTVRIQGMYTSEQADGFISRFSYVYRVGPGCCGTDGDLCGLQIILPEGTAPAEGDWIDVYGTLRITEIEGFKFLVLTKANLVVDNEHRGLENVLHQI